MTDEEMIEERISKLLDDNKRCLDILNTEGTSRSERDEIYAQLRENRAKIRNLRIGLMGLTPEDRDNLSSKDVEHIESNH